jgi:hypothetical protein
MTSLILPNGISEEARNALLVFSPDEIENMTAFRECNGEFIGIGCIGPGGVYTRFAEPKKALAIEVLEKEYRKELMAMAIGI